MTLNSPLNIEFLLWCHTRLEPHPNAKLPVYQDIIDQFSKNGIIVKAGLGEHNYKTTPKGDAWVAMLCNLQEPRAAYVDAHGKVIER